MDFYLQIWKDTVSPQPCPPDEHLDIVSEGVKIKKSMLVKLRKKIPDIKILKFFQVEVKTEEAYFYFFSENIPLLK